MLTEARAELRGAMPSIDGHADRLRASFRRHPRAKREVLGIEVLAALGDAEGAS
jgi:hypothetical protein